MLISPIPTSPPTRRLPCTSPRAYEPLMVVLSALPISHHMFPLFAPVALMIAELEEFCIILLFTVCHISPQTFPNNHITVPIKCTLSRVVALANPATPHTSPSPNIRSNVLITDPDTVRSDMLAALVCLKSPIYSSVELISTVIVCPCPSNVHTKGDTADPIIILLPFPLQSKSCVSV